MRRTLLLALAFLFLVPLLPGDGLHAEEEAASVRLSRARDRELDQRNFPQALEMYEALVDEQGLDAPIRGAALLGMGRCHRALGQAEEAEAAWRRILDDPSLPVDVRERAEAALNEIRAERSAIDPALAQEEAQRRLAEQRRAKAAELLEQARRAHGEGRYELARQLCLDALSWAPDDPRAAALLTEIEETMPDRAELLRTLLRFANTTSIQAFLRTKARFETLDRDGRGFFKAEDYAHADNAFRDAITLIDGSEFFSDLQSERAHAIRWLTLTIEKAASQGMQLGDVPELPNPGDVAPSFQRRFYDLLSEVFTARPDEDDPLVLYDTKSATLRPRTSERGLVAGAFPAGISVTRDDADGTRAGWAERWIRQNLGTGWATSSLTRRSAGPPRILDRFGDMLLVQHRRGVHAKIEALLDTFPNAPTPLVMDVAVCAATPAGGTRLAERLGARAQPRESGRDLSVSRLVEECVPLVQNLEGVRLLGTARLSLGSRPAATLEITQRADRHPAYTGLPIPRLFLAEDEARFGLWLDVYAEDLVRAAGARRAAIGLAASTRVPTGTIVVPKRSAEGDWTRLPRPLAVQTTYTDHVLPHASTLIVQGLANPFPLSAVLHPGLVLLLGVRPAPDTPSGTSIPDPPRTPHTANGRAAEREFDLGPLATEVADEVLDSAWPRRPSSVPLPAATLRTAREAYLSTSLGSTWSKLVAPGETSPVVVRGRVATARLPAREQERLEQAVRAFRARETDLYEVDVRAATTDEATLAEWLRAADVQSFTAGTYLITTQAGVQALDRNLRPAATSGGLYALETALLARATQKVAARNLHTLTIVEDLRFWRHTDGETQRQIPVLGTAEEGLVALVRPELEGPEGRRLVVVDVQAARLKGLESLLLPDVELETARITVPRHYPPQRRQAAAPLGDDEALVLTLPTPEGGGRVIVLRVRVKKIQ